MDDDSPLDTTSTSFSSRVTRSSARLAAGSPNSTATDSPTAPVAARPPPPARKRKAAARDPPSPEQPPASADASARRRPKRTKVEASEPASAPTPAASTRRRKVKGTATMSSAGPSIGSAEETTSPPTTRSSSASKRKTNRRKPAQDSSLPITTPSTRRSRKATAKADGDVAMKDAEDQADGKSDNAAEDQRRPSMSDDDNEEAAPRHYDDDDEDDDPFESSYLSRAGGPLSTLRALSGMMSGVTSQLRGILENLRQKDNPSMQLSALMELSHILLVSTEDNLAGHFSPDAYVKELVSLMQPNEFGEENSEIMLLACRCLANLMEALPASTANVVYGGAVPVLCQKLLEISYIDLAEQALSTLEKISVEFPASIVREGGLAACLNFLDFFATRTQRTAVTTAANCCRNIPEDCFPAIRDVMLILLNILDNSDQKVVEQGCLCVSRIVESFKYQESKLEELVNADLLRAVLRLLLPGSTNLIGSNIHTQFLRVLSITARASPRLCVELFKMNVVDTLYQILTGVSPPSGTDDIAAKIDSVVIMQALIHRPREQIYETLNVICELLPNVQRDGLTYLDDLFDAGYPGDEYVPLSVRGKKSPNDNKAELLEDCKDEVKRFAVILFPTLTDAYSSTVNLSVRQKVLTAQLKMLSNLDTNVLEDALRTVPYASFLAAILSQQDHPTLVTFALQAVELLLKRLEPIYRYQFYREGVISEISKLANRPCKSLETKRKGSKTTVEVESTGSPSRATDSSAEDNEAEQAAEVHEDDDHSDEDEGHEIRGDHDEDDGSDSDSSSSSGHKYSANPSLPNADDIITLRANKFIQVHENGSGKDMRVRAEETLNDLKSLAQDIKSCYTNGGKGSGTQLFGRLANYFDGDALESITSYELLTSDIVAVLLEVFSDANSSAAEDARSAFLGRFMGPKTQAKLKTATSDSPATPFSILVHKLQDLLSRSEHFEVLTVHHNTFDSNRSSAASMLAKQIRIRLVADEDSGIPRAYRNIMVSIHAIATFKALDDYLRPRISLAERPKGSRPREGVSSAIAAYAAALAGRGDSQRRPAVPPVVPAPSDFANRTIPKRTTSSKPETGSASASQPSSSSAPEKPSGRRRAIRGQETQTQAVPPPPIIPKSSEDSQGPLECADEAQLSDDDEEMDEDGALNAIVDDLEEEVDDDIPDPPAVNMEAAATGKVTARKEDGTRIATPTTTPLPVSSASQSRSSAAARLAAAQQALASPSRPMSYAAAIQSVPQDWHIEFSVNDQPISNETTIYRAVHFNQTQPSEVSARSIWQTIHTIKFKRANGPPPTEPGSLSPPPELTGSAAASLPLSLEKNPTTGRILRLLSILHELNANIDEVLDDDKAATKLTTEPLSQFVNTKLTAKMNRQLEEPLIVASNCLPSWSEDLARLYPFLFPFETRHLFLQSTSFGYSRSMTRWQNSQASNDSGRDRHRDERPFLGRLQRQKVRISRQKILESAIKVMELYGSSPSVLEVEYFEEVGTGLGPTLEFYSTVSKEFSKKKLKLWRENDLYTLDEFAFGKRGLFPAPMSEDIAQSENGKRVLHLFKMLGKFIARSMLDSRIIDVSFNPTFFRIAASAAVVPPSLGAVKSVDEDLARSLKLLKRFANAKKLIDESGNLTPAQKVQAVQNIEIDGTHVEDLALDFTLPGYPSIELMPHGAETSVTIDNVALYVEKVLDATIGSGVQKQVEAFRSGFSQVFPYTALRAFTPDELVMLFGRVEEDWSLETLMDSVKADHGFNLDSKSVRNLLQTMSEFTLPQRRDFLQFVTGSPKLPIGGFKSLTPMLTVVCKPSEPPYTSDDFLPSVMTCVNYLKLPDYSSMEMLREKLNIAIKEGQGAFHLS